MKDQEKKKGRGKGFTYSIDNSIGYDLLPIIIWLHSLITSN